MTRIEGWARDGLTDVQIAEKMGITAACLYNYEKRYVEIFDALKRGKAPVDNEVESALLKRARGGFTVKETRIEKWKDAAGIERTHTVIIEREMPPDTTAQIYWLKNRRPKMWRDKREVEATVTDGVLENMQTIASLINNPVQDIDIENLSEEQAAAQEVAEENDD